ncbi:MAG: MBL fold metallo-hydrolase, partial [Candidatus Krumholzibacteria bacterium]|nr:MBL fold metallo-hydrolase [Candidatus Krumholzibacteria bacterium]
MVKPSRRWGIPVVMIAFVFCLFYTFWGGEAEGPVLQFCGAAREVGGSCLLVEADDVRFIVDCGALGSVGTGILPPLPDRVSFVILTHAHTDHCGLLPELYAAGFRGKVYCTAPTAELVPVMLRMTRGFSSKKVPRDDFNRALSGLTPVPFGEVVDTGRVSFTLRRAEHLLGAAFVEISIKYGDDIVRLVVSGDLGAGNSLLVPPIEEPGEADYVVMESTYGGTVRETSGATA